MKKYILLFVLILILGGLSGQNRGDINPPSRVKDKVAELYPHARNIKWVMEDGDYEANFRNEGKDISLEINSRGNLLATETEIEAYDLPDVSRDYIARNYAGKKITEAAKMVDNHGVITYEAEVDRMDLIFDDHGAFVKIVKRTGRGD
jgi:hypothetical protein